MTHAVVGSRGLGILAPPAAPRLAGFAALGMSLPTSRSAPATRCRPPPCCYPAASGRALLGLYLSAVALVWAAIVLPSTRDLTIADRFACTTRWSSASAAVGRLRVGGPAGLPVPHRDPAPPALPVGVGEHSPNPVDSWEWPRPPVSAATRPPTPTASSDVG